MNAFLRLVVCAGLVLAADAATPGGAVTNRLPGGSSALYALPARGWNGDLVVYCHGYEAPGAPPTLANLELDGVSIPEVIQRLGFAFAAPSYRISGLAVPTGVEDVRQTLDGFTRFARRQPGRVFVIGVSEGALIAVRALEQMPARFAGGLALCGPIGDFEFQTDYVCDFRVLFDRFFPGLLPGNATGVPAEVRTNWRTQYEPLLRAAVAAEPARALELLRVAHAASDPADPATIADTCEGVLWYDAFGAEDAARRLRGNPYGNQFRLYRGSSDDVTLNADVQRFRADPITRRTLESCQTSGRVDCPLVLLHTTLDEIVPYSHAPAYLRKANELGRSGRVRLLSIQRYGHCNFTLPEVLDAVALLLSEAGPRR